MWNLVTHLRLHFQLLLAPVFLWGWLLAGGGLTTSIAIAFIAVHVFLYSGVTAFNSYYDRDIGPVGGLERPPPVSPALLPFSIAVQLVGLLLAVLVNVPFLVACGAFVGLAAAYSHPRVRLKAHTLTSLLVVGLGQGALAFLAAWAARRGELGSALTLDGALGAVTASLLVLALYPLTQLYQVEEDAARGDRTIAVAWGARRCFAFAAACTVLGGVTMLTLVVRRFGALDAAVVAAGLGAQLVALASWARGFDPSQVFGNYRRVMRFNSASAGALGAYLLARLAFPS